MMQKSLNREVIAGMVDVLGMFMDVDDVAELVRYNIITRTHPIQSRGLIINTTPSQEYCI